ncbi:MAG: winged helix-turn-helix domain-containing protein, partial [Rhizobiales bacterium]|nr:winged helix-turn-helix domain-containing protein [Rhizobacter sp.]
MTPHAALGTYTFESCEVDTAAREVRLRGAPQPVAPRVFDLLAYLLEHRDRVVTKDELLNEVWCGALLSGSVIARAVMKVRQAIGDDADAPTLIRTVHRVGYRFVAPVVARDQSLTALPPADPQPATDPPRALIDAAVDTGKLRLAVLPFRNLTGDRELAWIELGLMSLVNQALEADERLHIASVAAVLNALAAEPSDEADDAPKARSLARLLGVQCTCGVTVTRTEHGVAFEYRVTTVDGITHAGRMEGAEPTAVCRQLIHRIEADLLEGEAAGLRLQSDDPWANQAFARAMQAFQLKNGESALKLIRVVLDLDPDNPAVLYGLLEILCQLGKPEALSLGERLLREAIEAGDYRRAADVHRLLAVATFHLHGETPEARRHSEESVRLAGPIDSSYRTQHIYNEAASSAYRRGDPERSRDLHRQVELASQRTGNDLQRLIAISSRALIEATQGNLVTARDLWEACLPQFEALKQRSRVMLLRCNLAQLSAALGLLDVAVQHADALVVLLPGGQIRWFNLQSLSMACVCYAEARRLDKIEHALAVAGLPDGDLVGGDLIHASVAEAQRDVCRSDFDAAAGKWRKAIDGVIQRNDGECAAMWAPALIHNEMRAGRHAQAEATAAELLQVELMKASPDLFGMRLHARALDLHARGDSTAARAKLAEALPSMHPSRWSVLVRLDAAWLDIERGDLEAAKRVLVGTFSWLQAHPIGQLVDARLQFALGRREMALAAMQRCAAFVQPGNDFVARVLECYGHTGVGRPPDVPAAPRLPSV